MLFLYGIYQLHIAVFSAAFHQIILSRFPLTRKVREIQGRPGCPEKVGEFFDGQDKTTCFPGFAGMLLCVFRPEM